MPYYEFDEDEEELGGYEAAAATVKLEKMSELVQALQAALVAKGFQSARISYDGGGDEGFAHFDYGAVNGVHFESSELAEIFKALPILEQPPASMQGQSWPKAYRDAEAERWREMTPAARWEELLSYFSHEIAEVLLDPGFGTGELTIRGQFEYDLRSGQVKDLPDEDR